MTVDVKYSTSATATGGRDGQASTADGSLNVKLSPPKELGGAGGPGNNPWPAPMPNSSYRQRIKSARIQMQRAAMSMLVSR